MYSQDSEKFLQYIKPVFKDSLVNIPLKINPLYWLLINNLSVLFHDPAMWCKRRWECCFQIIVLASKEGNFLCFDIRIWKRQKCCHYHSKKICSWFSCKFFLCKLSLRFWKWKHLAFIFGIHIYCIFWWISFVIGSTCWTWWVMTEPNIKPNRNSKHLYRIQLEFNLIFVMVFLVCYFLLYVCVL